MKYCISCYGSDSYVFSVPVRASEGWLKKVLRRKTLISGGRLSRKQFKAIWLRVPKGIEIGWDTNLKYFLEGRSSN